MRLVITLLVLIYTCPSVAVVTRHDVPAASYQLQQTPGFYIDMPHEGAGVLIDERWILTAAHVIYYDYRNKAIEIHGVENRIEKVVFHQQYRPDPGGWGQGDAKPLIDFLRDRSDVALLKLAKPVTHVQPIQRYSSDKEIGNMVTIYGKGATGTGLSGAQLDSKQPSFWQRISQWFSSLFSDLDENQQHRILYRYHNIIESVESNWFKIRFDKPDTALPLEGSVASGDSGGPAIIEKDGQPLLLGLASWTDYQGQLRDLVGGVYESEAVFVRVSAYNEWIDTTIASSDG